MAARVPCESLTTWHAESKTLPNQDAWEDAPFCLGIDTGIACIVDAPALPEHDVGEAEEDKSFFGSICLAMDKTNHSACAVVAQGQGVACPSGYGDGMYDVHLACDGEGLVVGVRITFVTDAIRAEVADDDSLNDPNVVRDMIVGPHLLAALDARAQAEGNELDLEDAAEALVGDGEDA